jgi:hypothetical protein
MRKADILVSLSFVFLGIIVVYDSVMLGFQWGRTVPNPVSSRSIWGWG